MQRLPKHFCCTVVSSKQYLSLRVAWREKNWNKWSTIMLLVLHGHLADWLILTFASFVASATYNCKRWPFSWMPCWSSKLPQEKNTQPSDDCSLHHMQNPYCCYAVDTLTLQLGQYPWSALSNRMNSNSNSMAVQFILFDKANSGYCRNLVGNETADRLAKEGSTKEQVTKSTIYKEKKTIIKTKQHQRWLQQHLNLCRSVSLHQMTEQAV